MIAITLDGQVYHFAWASGMSAITTGLATLSIVQVTTRALGSLVDDVVVTLVHMLQLDGVRRVNTSECKALNIMSPKDLLPLFVDERRLDDAIRSVKHVFDHRKEDLPSSVLLNLLHDVFESQPEGSEMAKALIDHRGLYASDPPCDNTASLTQVLLVLDMYVAVHELICLLGYFVRSFVGQDPPPCANANHVKHEAAQVIKLFDSQQSCAEESLANDSFLEMARIQPEIPWVFSTQALGEWIRAAAFASHCMKAFVIESLVDNAFALAESLTAHIPPTNLVVGAKTYQSKLAKKTLLQHGAKNTRLSEETVALCKALQHVSTVNDGWVFRH